MIVSLLLMMSVASAQDLLQWVSLPNAQVEVDGLPWYHENNGEFFRYPLRLKDTFRAAIWEGQKEPSGARLRFRSDTPVVALRLEFAGPSDGRNMHAFGETGVDLYRDGVYCETAIADKDAAPGKIQEHRYAAFPGPRADHEITVYLSLYKPVKIHAIGIDKNAKINPPRPFAISKPVVFYGTSITQGGCASRSGMSYQAILGRALNIDFVNLGFSGEGIGEPEVARAIAEIDAACFVLDYAQNNRTLESLEKVYDPFLSVLRAKHPSAPIIAVTPI